MLNFHITYRSNLHLVVIRLVFLILLGDAISGCTCFGSVGSKRKRPKPEPEPKSETRLYEKKFNHSAAAGFSNLAIDVTDHSSYLI